MGFPKATNIGGGSKGKVIVPNTQGSHGIPPGASANPKNPSGFNTPTTQGNKGVNTKVGGGGKKAPLD